MDNLTNTDILVSIIIPCRNEERFILTCLNGVLAFELPKDLFEVLIIDGMSTDSTRKIVRDISEKFPFIKLLDNPAKIVPTALNIGIRASSGEFIVRLDAHTEYPPGYVKACLALLEKTGAANAGGRVVTVPNGDGPWAIPVAAVTAHRFGVGSSAFRVGAKSGFVDTVPFGTFRRDIFENVGYFDERLTRNQDNEFNDRLRKAGYKIAFDPEIRSRYKNKSTLSGLLHQAFFTGMWNVYTLRLFPYTFKWRRFVPVLFVFYLLSIPLIRINAGSFNAYLIPVILYSLALMGITLSMPFQLAAKVRIAITFASYHLAYGIGTILGRINILTGIWKRHLGASLNK